ncbi:MAG: hypothetical protein WDA00_06670 [Eubacteriales bacterium]
MKKLKNIVFEMSLKPFTRLDQPFVEQVVRQVFTDWAPLSRHAESVGIMFWAADGSQILDYAGKLDDTFEWGRHIGGANKRNYWNQDTDPRRISMHNAPFPYCDQPVTFTYRDLKRIVETIKRIGPELTGLPVTVGETFDPGPEFAVSDFKYRRHRECLIIAEGNDFAFLSCRSTLHADNRPYAAYPKGIPEGEPFGTFLGKQAQRYFEDLGFDFIWFSNGFGFGGEATTAGGGATGGFERTDAEHEEDMRTLLKFWDYFTSEFHYPIRTRGTNSTAGLDFATCGANAKELYEKLDFLPPPNPPWSALDFNFGLELASYMSRMAELPGEHILYRNYLHDPWWSNSPWQDRYEGQPHDIYMTLACARLNEQGKVQLPDHMHILTIDNSFGEMPERCVLEPTAHFVRAFDSAPDAPSPLVWIYPFADYQTLGEGRRLKVTSEDWFMVHAINSGLPVSSVMSYENFLSVRGKDPQFLASHTLVIPVPQPDSPMNREIIRFVEAGGRVMLYGSLEGACAELRQLLGIRLEQSLDGHFTLQTNMAGDLDLGAQLSHAADYDRQSMGGVAEVADGCEVLSTVYRGDEKRVVLAKVQHGGTAVWCRGYGLPTKVYTPEKIELARHFAMAARFTEIDIRLVRRSPRSWSPMIMCSRHRSSLWFSACSRDTTVELSFGTELGAPLFKGFETYLQGGRSTYRFPRAWHLECRAFVSQPTDGVLVCGEESPGEYFAVHRMQINGLKNATVYILPLDDNFDKMSVGLDIDEYVEVSKPYHFEIVNTRWGRMMKLTDITGKLVIRDHNDKPVDLSGYIPGK